MGDAWSSVAGLARCGKTGDPWSDVAGLARCGKTGDPWSDVTGLARCGKTGDPWGEVADLPGCGVAGNGCWCGVPRFDVPGILGSGSGSSGEMSNTSSKLPTSR